MLAEATTALGHDVAAASIWKTGEPPSLINGVKVYRMPHETDFWPEDWPKYPKSSRFLAKFKQQFNRGIEARFAEVLDDFRPDIVHTHSLVDISTLVWRAAKARSLPIVHTLRDYSLVCSNASLFHQGERCKHRHLKCRILTFRRWRMQTLVDGVASVGNETLQRHLDLGLFRHIAVENRRVIWNPAVVGGVGPDYVRPDRSTETFTFGYLGRINVEKGVGTLIDACRHLPPNGWQLKIAGVAADGLQMFSEASAGMPIEFVGFVEPKDFFESIDVLVVPSIWPEPLPRTILESYAVGVPVIGARSGGIPDLIGETNGGWLFEPGEEAELAMRMHDVMRTPRSALPTRSDFAHVLSRTTASTVAENYLAFYRDVMQAQSAQELT